MIVIWIALSCAAEYFDLMKKGLLGRPAAPERCVSETCRRKNCYWRHGSYQRLVIDGRCSGSVVIERFKCKVCRKTISILPAFLVPKRWHSLALIAEKCESYAATESSYRRESNGPCKTPASSSSQIWRWIDLASKKARVLLLDVQAESVTKEVEEDRLLEADQAGCPNAWKARSSAKESALAQLAKVVAFGRVIFDRTEGILNVFGTRTLKNVEMMQQIIAVQAGISTTPQMVAPIHF
jgi:Domain of unknown function (DUF6431)